MTFFFPICVSFFKVWIESFTQMIQHSIVFSFGTDPYKPNLGMRAIWKQTKDDLFHECQYIVDHKVETFYCSLLALIDGVESGCLNSAQP